MQFYFPKHYTRELDVFDPKDLKQVLESLTGQDCPFCECTLARPGRWPHAPKQVTLTRLNGLLLWLGFDRVGGDFFKFFFLQEESDNKDEQIGWAEFLLGVHKVRVAALLRWGNIKFGFKRWAPADIGAIRKDLASYQQVPTTEYDSRPRELRDIEAIPLERTHLLGYLSDQGHDEAIVNEAQKTGKHNFARYLIQEYMDVYVATSMRHIDEYWHVGRLVQRLKEHKEIADLNLRFFDPTQAYCPGRVNKGLLEALMLLRCRCCVYCIQESDSFGKDSELASALAQGKPVVVYAPEYEELQTEFEEMKVLCEQADRDFDEVLTNKLIRFGVPKREYKKMSTEEKRERTLQETSQRFSKRGGLLRKDHPLSLQVNIDSGVVHGVLVATSVEQCGELVRRIFLREMDFRIDHVTGEPPGTVGLFEQHSECLFRVATGDELLTNTFWNFHQEELERPSGRRRPISRQPRGMIQ